MAAFLSKQIYQNGESTSLPLSPLNQSPPLDLIISPDRGQFQCPLCNKIGNFLLPIYDLDKEKAKDGHEKNDEMEATDEKGVSWIDWILTETERVTTAAEHDRGKKRELSAESESREDILAALTRHIDEDDDGERSESQPTSTRSPPLPCHFLISFSAPEV
jgi:hypothetical protein